MGEQLRVRTFGGLELSEGQYRVDAPAKAKALVAYVALAPPNATRSRLAGLLWSDLPEETMSRSLLKFGDGLGFKLSRWPFAWRPSLVCSLTGGADDVADLAP